MAREKVGVLVGRFQPFHRGHLSAVRHALRRTDQLIIVVGSADKSHDARNPFTAGERITMIRLAVIGQGVDPRRWMIIPITDTDRHGIWVSWVELLLPKFDRIFSNDPLTIQLFSEKGYVVEEVPLARRSVYMATEIRRRIIQDGDWKVLVPAEVAEYVESIGGVERIRKLGAPA